MKLQWMLLSLISAVFANPALAQVVLAQVVSDTTLGAESTIVTPNGTTQTITGGATRGSNLFHSLQELSIGTNQTAWFDNPLTIQNILVRVTGSNRSEIDGTIRSNGTADLFLINPNGIIFGQNAKLNIGGAFSALTTDAIPLGDQGLFSATNPAQSQLLDVKPNVAFDLARFQPKADIQMNASWNLANGQAITLVGQNLRMAGSLNHSGLQTAPAATLTLRSANNITLDNTQINHSLGTDLYVAEPNLATVRLILQAGAGNITIKDSNIGLYGGLFQATAAGTIVVDNSRLLSQNTVAKPSEAISIQGGKVEIINKSGITILAQNDLSQTNLQPAVLNIRSTTAPLLINSTRINQPPQDRALRPAAFDPANAPRRSNLSPTQITLATPQDITIQNSAIAPRGAAFEAIIPGNFALLGSQLYSDNFTGQAAQPMTITAQNILLDRYNRPRGQASQVGRDIGISSNSVIRGQAANINLSARNDISIKGTAGIGSNTITNANTGNIILNAGNKFEIKDGGIGNVSRPDTSRNRNQQIQGNNGQLIITAKNIDLDKFGFNMDHFSQGGNGLIKLDAQDTITIGEGGIGTNARGSAQGADIIVKAGQQLLMKSRAALSTSAEQQSIGGNIQIDTQQFTLQGSVSTSTKSSKNAGAIQITAANTILDEGVFVKDNKPEITRGTISSYTGTSKGELPIEYGNSGNITLGGVGANSTIRFKSGAGIANTVFRDSTGSTGKITVQAGQLEIQGGSQILAVTNTQGRVGLIDIQTTQGVDLTGTSPDGKSPSGILSTIQTSAKNGSTQGIQINTGRLNVKGGAGIIASTLGEGNSGKVEITADTAVFADKASGVLTSVGIGQIPQGEIIKIDPGDGRFTLVTLNPLLIRTQQGNAVASGDSGQISLQVGNLDVLSGAKLVTTIVKAGKAGDVVIRADRNIRLVDQAAVSADSGSGLGGSITLTSRNGILFLRGKSEISAVSRFGGEDGNITINAPFIVGLPNDDSNIFAISAEALKGGRSVGNNVNITAQGVLGFEYRTQFTPQNDIIATGNVTLNLPDIDPSRGLTILPTDPIEAAQKIDRACHPNADSTSSSFVSMSKGGLPANPTTPIVPEMGLTRLAQIPNTSQVSNTSPAIDPPHPTIPREASTMQRLANRTIRFKVGDHVPAVPKPNCG